MKVQFTGPKALEVSVLAARALREMLRCIIMCRSTYVLLLRHSIADGIPLEVVRTTDADESIPCLSQMSLYHHQGRREQCTK